MPHGNANPISEKNIVPEFTCIYVDISLLKKEKNYNYKWKLSKNGMLKIKCLK